ncbi:MAG TPA: acyltransferase, partial [Acidimicrobiia bacterium]|nr:acyltransferase [Acidimicrobiia bacterium]
MHSEAGARVGSLDGLRAVAVIAVVAYHLWPHALPSGFLGVDMFMVLSGFLITGLLLREHRATGTIRLGAFWGRRFRRLIPALMLMLAAVALFVYAFGPDTMARPVRVQGIAALLYVANWKLVLDGVSYGGQLAAHSPLVHLWSLGIEEQFYLLWPLVCFVLLRTQRGRQVAPFVAVAGAAASAVLMAVLYQRGTDTARLYYGTDTRAHAFLLGATSAFVLPRLRSRARAALSIAGPLAFGLLAV